MPIPQSTNVGTYIEQATKPRSLSPVTWWALVGTAAALIVPGGGARVGLLLHNPGSAANLLYLPGTVDGAGNPISAGGHSFAGSLFVAPGQYVYIGQDSPIGNSLFVVADTGSNNPATVWEFI